MEREVYEDEDKDRQMEANSWQGEDTEDWSAPVEELIDSQRGTSIVKAFSPLKPSSVKSTQKSTACTGDLSHERVIIHFDIDCFYAQVEMIRNPALRDKPLGIQQKNIVVTCNYVARSRGVTKLSYVKEAMKKCPELVLVCGEDLTLYRDMSYKITELLQRYTPLVERLGFDENFVDVTKLVKGRLNERHDQTVTLVGHTFKEESVGSSCICGCDDYLKMGSQIAADIRHHLLEELGITCCAGIAVNKLLAKLVAGTHKPNQQTTLFTRHADQLMVGLTSVRNIPGIGSSSAKRLAGLEIRSVCDLRACDVSHLVAEFGDAAARHMVQLSMGVDDSPVIPSGQPQSISDEDSFRSCTDSPDVRRRILGLLESLLKRLIVDGRIPNTIRLTIRKILSDNKWSNRESRQCQIPSHIFKNFSQDTISVVRDGLCKLCMELFHKIIDVNTSFHLTLINVCFSKFCSLPADGSVITSFFKQPVKSEKTSSYSTENADNKVKLLTHRKKRSSLDGWLKQPRHVKTNDSKPSDSIDKSQGAGSKTGDEYISHWDSESDKAFEEKLKQSSVLKSGDQQNTERIGIIERKNRKVDIRFEISQIDTLCGQNSNGRLQTCTRSKEAATCDLCPLLSTSDVTSPPAKKIKLSEGNERTDDDEGVSVLPSDVDRDVFNQLPVDLQVEIMKQFKEQKSTVKSAHGSVFDTPLPQSSTNHPSDSFNCKTNKTLLHHEDKLIDTACVDNKDQQASNSESETSLRHRKKLFFKKVNCRIDSRHTDNVCMEETPGTDESKSPQKRLTASENLSDSVVSNMQASQTLATSSGGVGKCADVIKEDCVDNNNIDSSDCSNTVASGVGTGNHSKTDRQDEQLFIPDEFDKSVFVTLPVDIQKELIDDWRRKQALSSSTASSQITTQKSSVKNNTLKKNKSKGIMDFFKRN